jgi:HEAT repeat protein
MQAQGDVRGLLDALKNPDAATRLRVITAIRALGMSSAIPGLQAVLVTESDPEVRAVLIATLDFLFEQEVDQDDDDDQDEQENRIRRLIEQLNSDKPEAVIEAAQTLGDLKEKIATEALVIAFHNQRLPAKVRFVTAEALLKLESAPVEVSLLGALRGPDWRSRRNAAAVLGQLSADWAVEPLIAGLTDENELVRRTCHAALKRIDTPEAIRALETPAQTRQTLPPVEMPVPSTPALELPKPPAVTPRSTASQTTVAAEAAPAPTPELAPTGKRTTSTFPKVALPTVASVLSLDKLPEPTDEDTQPTRPQELPDDAS